MNKGKAHTREEKEASTQSRLAFIPEWVVPLGAGFLLASTIISLIGAIVGWYLVATGNTYGHPTYALVILSIEFTGITIAQGAATYWARHKMKWMSVILMSLLGLLLFVTIPLNLSSLVCLGLGKRHFSSHTPAKFLK